MFQLREYQQRAVDELYKWFRNHNTGNPVLQLPTGAGKSFCIAKLCMDASNYRVLMVTHQSELVQQNAEKLRLAWPNAPMGICCASLGRRQLDQPITFGTIGSLINHTDSLGKQDLVLVDECHRISCSHDTMYRKLIKQLKDNNPKLRVIGLTATPYRLGQGYITNGENALFDDIIDPVNILHLMNLGYLCELRSKSTDTKLDTAGVHKRGGEFVKKELNEAVNNTLTNKEAVQEIIKRGNDRRSWIVFCSGVKHAMSVRDDLVKHGIKAECLTGKTKKADRNRILKEFKGGQIRCVTNCDVLTTGFDHTGIDLVALMRPTMSASLYVQMVGRGLRVDEDKQDCLVLDFAGNIERHGPITMVTPVTPRDKKEKGDAPVKECPAVIDVNGNMLGDSSDVDSVENIIMAGGHLCRELVHASVMTCPSCGYKFPKPTKHYSLSKEDIMGLEDKTIDVKAWSWRRHVSKRSEKEMLVVNYIPADLSKDNVVEYVCLGYKGYAGVKAKAKIDKLSNHTVTDIGDLRDVADYMNTLPCPNTLTYAMQNGFYNVKDYKWNDRTPRTGETGQMVQQQLLTA